MSERTPEEIELRILEILEAVALGIGSTMPDTAWIIRHCIDDLRSAADARVAAAVTETVDAEREEARKLLERTVNSSPGKNGWLWVQDAWITDRDDFLSAHRGLRHGHPQHHVALVADLAQLLLQRRRLRRRQELVLGSMRRVAPIALEDADDFLAAEHGLEHGLTAILEAGVARLLLLSQAVLSLQLPFAVVPLVRLTSDRAKMGDLVNPWWLTCAAWGVAAIVLGLDLILVVLSVA